MVVRLTHLACWSCFGRVSRRQTISRRSSDCRDEIDWCAGGQGECDVFKVYLACTREFHGELHVPPHDAQHAAPAGLLRTILSTLRAPPGAEITVYCTVESSTRLVGLIPNSSHWGYIPLWAVPSAQVFMKKCLSKSRVPYFAISSNISEQMLPSPFK